MPRAARLTQAQDGKRATLRDIGELHSPPRSGQDVREVEESLVGRPLRHRDRPKLGLRHAQVLGLTPGHGPVEARVPEERRPLPWSRCWVVSHCAYSSRSHIQQWPQEMLNGMTTRSPGLMW